MKNNVHLIAMWKILVKVCIILISLLIVLASAVFVFSIPMFIWLMFTGLGVSEETLVEVTAAGLAFAIMFTMCFSLILQSVESYTKLVTKIKADKRAGKI